MADQYTTVAPEGWKTFDDFIADMTTYRFPATQELAGKELTFDFTDRSLQIKFGKENLQWKVGSEHGENEDYELINTAPDVYFLTYKMKSRPTECQVVVFNLKTRRAMSVLSYIKSGDIKGEPRFGQKYTAGTIAGGTATGMVPHKTKELTGIHAIYEYSDDHHYEHYYITSEYFCWKGLSGPQKGDCAIEPATYWKFDEGQYVFGWTEVIIPCAPTWFISFDNHHETGSFCYATPEGSIRVEKAGATFEKLVQTFYPSKFEAL